MTDIAMGGAFRLADVFSKAFSIFGRRIVPFVILTVLGQLPNYVVLFTLGAVPAPGESTAVTLLRVGLLCLNVLTAFLAIGAMTYAVIQELRGQALSVGDSIGAALSRFWPIIGILLMCALILVGLWLVAMVLSIGVGLAGAGLGLITSPMAAGIAGGVVAAIVVFPPMCIAMCMLYVVTPVCVVEKAGVFASMSRSRFLTKGHRWQVFGMFLLITVVAYGLIGIIGFATGRGFLGVASGGGALAIAYNGLMAFVGAFFGILTGVFYYDLRVAKEGIDIHKIGGVFD